jgi:hypothetical protein
MGPILKFEGGAAAPNSPHPTIRLDAQEVTIRLGKRTYFVEATFHFLNEGETTTQWVGFPKRVFYWGFSPGDPHTKGFDDFRWFKVWVDGERAAITEEPDLADTGRRERGEKRRDKWMALRATFPGHRQTSLRCTYEAMYQWGSYGSERTAATYLFGTGSYWKGPIGSAVFIIDSTDIGGSAKTRVFLGSCAGPRTVSPNVVRYELGEFEPSPKDQIEVVTKVPEIPMPPERKDQDKLRW